MVELFGVDFTYFRDIKMRALPVCTHELLEKLLSTYLSSPLKAPTRTLVEAYIGAKKTNDTRKLTNF